MNMVLDKQVVFWLMKYVGHKLYPDQFGGQKGSSISHYLIEMTNFILYNQDLKNPLATIATYLDYKQGFNRCQHSKFIEIVAKDYNTPGWLVRILVGFLSKRKLKIRYKNKIGEEEDIPGGAAQGGPLGLWVFLFMIDCAGPERSPESIGWTITKPPKQRKRMSKTKKKWIDDFTVLSSIDLKRFLEVNTEPVRPVTYHDRTEHRLPRKDNIQQDEIDKIVNLSVQRNMQLSQPKTKTMIFNPLRKYDVFPEISIKQGELTELVEEQKILGNIVRSDLKTISNTEYICTRAYRRMWILRRLKSLGCPIPELLDVLRQQVVSICEGSAAYWGPMITKIESNMLERCLKTGLHIIYQEAYLSFNNALQLSNMKSLKLRRLELITRFSKKALLSSKYRDWFCQSEERTSGMTTRGKPVPLLKPVTCRTQRYERSSLLFMTKMLSWHPPLRHISLDLA